MRVARSLRREPSLEIRTTRSPTRRSSGSRTKTVAVLVSDYEMPKMTGAQLAGKARRVRPETVRILLTGMQLARDRGRRHQPGRDFSVHQQAVRRQGAARRRARRRPAPRGAARVDRRPRAPRAPRCTAGGARDRVPRHLARRAPAGRGRGVLRSMGRRDRTRPHRPRPKAGAIGRDRPSRRIRHALQAPSAALGREPHGAGAARLANAELPPRRRVEAAEPDDGGRRAVRARRDDRGARGRDRRDDRGQRADEFVHDQSRTRQSAAAPADAGRRSVRARGGAQRRQDRGRARRPATSISRCRRSSTRAR